MENTKMSDYEVLCSQEQTKKAYELGAPCSTNDVVLGCHISNTKRFVIRDEMPHVVVIPTAEEMFGWLEEQTNLSIEVLRHYGSNMYSYWIFDNNGNDIENFENKFKFNSRKEATLAAIDAALDYMAKNKNIMKKLYDVLEDDIIIKSFETLEEANKWCVDNYRGDYIIKDNKVYSINYVQEYL